MPEGHTIHREARDQRPMLAGQILTVTSPQGRFAEGAARLNGQRCLAIEAYGKHLLYRFATGDALHIHLGLFGIFRKSEKREDGEAEPKGAVRVRLASSSHAVDINGPNTCEVLDPAQEVSLIGRIGPDVLRADAVAQKAYAKIAKSRAPIGVLLMDQSVMAGVGNIYRSEILWRQKIHPEAPGSSISEVVFQGLWADAVQLLEIGVRENAIITVEGALPSRSKYGERVNIFGKTQCPACGGAIRVFELASRRVYACEACQARG